MALCMNVRRVLFRSLHDRLEPGGCRDDRSEGEEPLTDRTEVTHEAGIGLFIELLGTRPRRDDSVEPRNGATGDRDKQQRHAAWSAFGEWTVRSEERRV